MKEEDKQLLLKDLCARLPYGVKCKIESKFYAGTQFKDCKTIDDVLDGLMIHSFSQPFAERMKEDYISNLKPYLRPLSSMTEKEKREFDDNWFEGYHADRYEEFVSETEVPDYIDWLNAHHFDYRGLIPKDLAIEVTKDNNPYSDIKL